MEVASYDEATPLPESFWEALESIPREKLIEVVEKDDT